MAQMSVTGVRGVDLGVRDLPESARFYTSAWGLERVASDRDTVYLRATGTEHHVLALHRRPQSNFMGARFAVRDKAAVDGLHTRALAFGVVCEAPRELPAIAGGGYGFSLRTPDGVALSIGADVARHDAAIDDRTRPAKFSHVVFRTSACEDSEAFFCDLLGFKVSDRTDHIHFLRCARDHHSVALARVAGPGLHHMAFELPDIDALMSATGRVKLAGHEIGWGTGRHAGPANNVFSVFVEPDGFAAELTTEMEQVDDSYPIRDPNYWRSRPLRPCSWGIAMQASQRLRDAQAGMLADAAPRTCDDVVSTMQSH